MPDQIGRKNRVADAVVIHIISAVLAMAVLDASLKVFVAIVYQRRRAQQNHDDAAGCDMLYRRPERRIE